MKKVLLGTTALVAAGFVASAATADEMMAEPVSVGVGGYYRVAIGNVDGSDGMGEPEQNRQRLNLGQDSELNIGGSTTLDNGMTVGVAINLEVRDGNADAGGDGADESHIYFEGAFGKIQFGAIESARQQKVTFAPNGAGNFGVNTPFFTFASGSWLSTYDDGLGAEDSIKLVYTTPSFNGFQLGLSYAPDDTEAGQYGDFFGNNNSNDEGQYENQAGVGLSFAQDFAGGSLSMSAGYETYDAELPDGASCDGPVTGMYKLDDKLAALAKAGAAPGATMSAVELAIIAGGGDNTAANPLLSASDTLEVQGGTNGHTVYEFVMPGQVLAPNCSPETLNFGLTMGFGAFTVGGGWMQTDLTDNNSRTVMDVGVSWSDGPMTLGLQYGSSESEATGMSDASNERYALNGTYVLGPGVDIQAQLDFGESDAAGPADPTADNEWVQFMIGSAVTF